MMQFLSWFIKTIGGVLSGITAVALIVIMVYGGYKVGIAVVDWMWSLL